MDLDVQGQVEDLQRQLNALWDALLAYVGALGTYGLVGLGLVGVGVIMLLFGSILLVA